MVNTSNGPQRRIITIQLLPKGLEKSLPYDAKQLWRIYVRRMGLDNSFATSISPLADTFRRHKLAQNI